MSAEPKIKPCPFCGFKADYYSTIATFYPYLHKVFRVRCNNLKCLADGKSYKTSKGAIRWWNRRKK